MNNQAYGWTCPKCGAVYAPWQSFCPPCAVLKTYTGMGTGTLTGYSGTITLGGFYSCPGSKTKTETEQAQEAVDNWLAKGFEVKALIGAAVDNLVARTCEEDEDDD